MDDVNELGNKMIIDLERLNDKVNLMSGAINVIEDRLFELREAASLVFKQEKEILDLYNKLSDVIDAIGTIDKTLIHDSVSSLKKCINTHNPNMLDSKKVKELYEKHENLYSVMSQKLNNIGSLKVQFENIPSLLGNLFDKNKNTIKDAQTLDESILNAASKVKEMRQLENNLDELQQKLLKNGYQDIAREILKIISVKDIAKELAKVLTLKLSTDDEWDY